MASLDHAAPRSAAAPRDLAPRSSPRRDLPTAARLDAGQSLAVADGEATTIRIDAGIVWLTEEGSFVDHVLGAGQRYTFDRPGTALVTARSRARVTLIAPRRGPPPASITLDGVPVRRRPLAWRIAAWLLPTWWRRPARRAS